MRNWKKVNKKYREEGFLYFSFDFLRTWKREISILNTKKRGGQYRYPDSLIRFCSTLKIVFGVGYRQMDGLLQSIKQFIPIEQTPDYTTIYRRFNRLGLDLISSLADVKDGQTIALDSTGIKLYQSGEWIREKHKKRKPFLKLHVAVNVKTKQATASVMTEDNVSDGEMTQKLIEKSQEYAPIKEVLGDGAYDRYKIWYYVTNKNVKPVIRLRKDAIPNGLNPRACAVRERDRIGVEEWKQIHNYGKRWLVEIWYSSFKRRFGEHCSARKEQTIRQELLFKTMLTNQMIL